MIAKRRFPRRHADVRRLAWRAGSALFVALLCGLWGGAVCPAVASPVAERAAAVDAPLAAASSPARFLLGELLDDKNDAPARDVFVGLPEDETPPPDVLPDGSVLLCGVPVPPAQTAVDLGEAIVTDVPALMAALDLLPALRRVDMYESRLSDDGMALLFARYPAIRFGWTVRVASYTIRTDDTVFSMHDRDPEKVRYWSESFRNLTYCRDMRAVDLGHNYIIDISFLQNMKDLRILILADNRITDISPLTDLRALEYVELFRNKLTDISPLADKPALLDLNLCLNYIADATPLLGLPRIERLWLSRNKLPPGTARALRAAHPDCQMNFEVHFSTDGGWRRHDRFYIMRYVLNERAYHPFSDGIPQGLNKSKYK